MSKNYNNILFLGITLGLVTSCNPQKEYDKFILKQGYIPFRQPASNIGVGSLIAGQPSQLTFVAPREACFPSSYKDVPTQLLALTDVDLSEISKKFTLDATIEANVLATNGTPLFKLKTEGHKIKSVDIHVESASIEYLNQYAFYEWVNTSMSTWCKDRLINGTPFINQALKVDKMSFQFLDESSGKIELNTEKIKDIIELDVNVTWKITNKFTLTITSPKYIGYHLAKVSNDDPSSVAMIANSLNGNKFKFVPTSGNFKVNNKLVK